MRPGSTSLRARRNDQVKIIAANPVMIAAYREGFPANGKPVPDGAMLAKLEWAKKPSPEFPAQATVPGVLQRGVHGEGLEEISGHEWMGIRRFQV
jgi:cytochrome P460